MGFIVCDSPLDGVELRSLSVPLGGQRQLTVLRGIVSTAVANAVVRVLVPLPGPLQALSLPINLLNVAEDCFPTAMSSGRVPKDSGSDHEQEPKNSLNVQSLGSDRWQCVNNLDGVPSAVQDIIEGMPSVPNLTFMQGEWKLEEGFASAQFSLEVVHARPQPSQLWTAAVAYFPTDIDPDSDEDDSDDGIQACWNHCFLSVNSERESGGKSPAEVADNMRRRFASGSFRRQIDAVSSLEDFQKHLDFSLKQAKFDTVRVSVIRRRRMGGTLPFRPAICTTIETKDMTSS